MNISELIKEVATPQYRNRPILKNQKATDIMKYILIADLNSRKFYPTLKKKFYNPDKEQLCKTVWQFVKRNIKYNAEPSNRQTIKEVNRIIFEPNENDCKHYSTLIGCILGSCNIPYEYKLVSFAKDKIPTHVYIIAYLPTPFILDCCCDSPDTEPSHTKAYFVKPLKKNEMMYYLNGMKINETPLERAARLARERAAAAAAAKNKKPHKLYASDFNNHLSGDDYIDGKFKDKVKEKIKDAKETVTTAVTNTVTKVENGAKAVADAAVATAKNVAEAAKSGNWGGVVATVAAAPSRAAFEGLVIINAFGLADKLVSAYKKDAGKVTDFWKKVGGDVGTLKKAINKGSKSGSITGINDIYGQGVGVTTAAAVAAATPIIIAAATLFKTLGINIDTIKTAISKGKDTLKNSNEVTKFDSGALPQTPDDDKGISTTTMLGFGAAAAAGLYLATKKK